MTFDDIWQQLVRQNPAVAEQDPQTVEVFRDFYHLGFLAGQNDQAGKMLNRLRAVEAHSERMQVEFYKRRGR